jgi:hypothetical protein
LGAVEDGLISELRAIRFALASSSGRRIARPHLPLFRALERVEQCFKRPLRLAVLGEGNSGKSLLINYLLKHHVLPAGGFTGENTAILIRYAREPAVFSIGSDGHRNRLTSKAFGLLVKPENRVLPSTPAVIYDAALSPASRTGASAASMIFPAPKRYRPQVRLIEVGLPIDVLKRVEIVEVRNYPEAEPTSPAARVFRDVGLTIWCTLATQAWKETEVLAWKRVPELHRKGALMLVTYKDAIRHAKDEAKITARLKHAASSLFDDVALVSLRDAIQSLISADDSEGARLRAESNVDGAESAIVTMIRNWQMRRLQKASRIIRMIASRLAGAASGLNVKACRELAIRLERLAAEFRHASPSISLADQAA